MTEPCSLSTLPGMAPFLVSPFRYYWWLCPYLRYCPCSLTSLWLA